MWLVRRMHGAGLAMSGLTSCGSCLELFQHEDMTECTGLDAPLCEECFVEWSNQCTCYEANGGHEPGCPRKSRPLDPSLTTQPIVT